jgi:hypothetical protein
VASRADTTLKPDAGLTSEQASDVRARAWSYVFECFNRHTKKKAAPASGPDAGKEINERSGKSIIPDR